MTKIPRLKELHCGYCGYYKLVSDHSCRPKRFADDFIWRNLRCASCKKRTWWGTNGVEHYILTYDAPTEDNALNIARARRIK